MQEPEDHSQPGAAGGGCALGPEVLGVAGAMKTCKQLLKSLNVRAVWEERGGPGQR